MLRETPQSRLAALTAEVEKHRELYYRGEPEISDAQYDALVDELEELTP